jgi:branched-chain amino acid transport system ATP-binding protein
MLDLNNVQAYYGTIQALKGVTLDVQTGEIVTLIGANGAGKSTTLMAISSVVAVRSGAITFEGRPITRLPTDKIVALGITQVPEGRMIFPALTVLENLRMGGYLRRDRAGLKADEERAFELFPILKARRKQDGGTLSGGEQQMLAMARALMARPKLLLLDEPSLGLAPMVVEHIFETIVRINAEGTTILLVEQNAQMALQVAHRAYVLETGRVVMSGTAAQLISDPGVQEAYLGIDAA